jgi:hypothetical protein
MADIIVVISVCKLQSCSSVFFFFLSFWGEFLHCGCPQKKKNKKPSANSTKAFYWGEKMQKWPYFEDKKSHIAICRQ